MGGDPLIPQPTSCLLILPRSCLTVSWAGDWEKGGSTHLSLARPGVGKTGEAWDCGNRYRLYELFIYFSHFLTKGWEKPAWSQSYEIFSQMKGYRDYHVK